MDEYINKGRLRNLLGIRTPIDVCVPNLTGLKAMLELRKELKDNVTIRIKKPNYDIELGLFKRTI